MTQHDRNQYILGMAALDFSAIAMLMAFFELRSSDRQLETNVWPYVDMSLNLDADRFGLSLENKGMGPALIHEFRVLHNGEAVGHAVDLLDMTDRELENLSFTTASVPDSVLSVGEELIAFQIEGEGVGLALRDLVADLDIQICYCSLNDQCWDNRSDTGFRRNVRRCESQQIDVGETLEYFDVTNDAPSQEGAE